MLKALLLDMDGTLIDSEAHYINGTYTWMKREGYAGNIEAIYPIIGMTMKETYAHLQTLLPLEIDQLATLNDHYFYEEAPLDYPALIFPEVKGALKSFKEKGLRLGLCTSDGPYEVRTFLNSCDLNAIFDVIVDSQSGVKAKPDPGIYRKALELLDLKSAEAWAMEDSKAGIISAKRADLLTFARKDHHFKIDQSAADHLIEDLNELSEWVDNYDK